MTKTEYRTRFFERDILLNILWGDIHPHVAEVVCDEIVEHSRWSVRHRLVFRYGVSHYVVAYSVGATEQQDERPWEYDGDRIECTEVERVEVTKVDWKAVRAGDDDD